jgi:hypothetical protein
MRERRSEVFEEYAKVAEKMGLVAPESQVRLQTKTAQRNMGGATSKTPGVIDNPNNGADSWMRWDTGDISAPEAFYGVKPNKDIENGLKNMMEQAHPESVVIAPAYDRINGLVENNIERQKIIINILSRNPTGNANYRKLAQRALMMELVRVGNHLDNTNEEELRALADSCMQRLANFEDEELTELSKEPSYEGRELISELTPEDDDWDPAGDPLEGMTVPAPEESSFVSAVGDSNPLSDDEMLAAVDAWTAWCRENNVYETLKKLKESTFAQSTSSGTKEHELWWAVTKASDMVYAPQAQDVSDILDQFDALQALYEVGSKERTILNGLKVIVNKYEKILQQVSAGRTANVSSASDQNDVSPKGWGKTVEKMKKHKELDNPFALAYWMKGEGYKPHPNKN